jgi:hypothetical protein
MLVHGERKCCLCGYAFSFSMKNCMGGFRGRMMSKAMKVSNSRGYKSGCLTTLRRLHAARHLFQIHAVMPARESPNLFNGSQFAEVRIEEGLYSAGPRFARQ